MNVDLDADDAAIVLTWYAGYCANFAPDDESRTLADFFARLYAAEYDAGHP